MLNRNSLKEVLLDLKGRYICVAVNENGNLEKKFDWGNALADAAIFATIGAFTTYGGSLTAGVSTLESLHTAVIAGVLQFATFLGIKRGVIRHKE